jgi:hypothetical protein
MEEKLAVPHKQVAKELDFGQKWEGGALTASFDMGWQQRGRSYNSLHAFLVDAVTGKVVGMKVYSKR